jgi:beta-alanine--pyruvate transaminase
MSECAAVSPPNMSAFWMLFIANRQFKGAPRCSRAAKGKYYTTHDGRRVLDGMAGLWCMNAGHCCDEIVAAVQARAAEMGFAPTSQMGHLDRSTHRFHHRANVVNARLARRHLAHAD